MPQGLIYALFFASPLVPLLDRLFPREHADVRFQWSPARHQLREMKHMAIQVRSCSPSLRCRFAPLLAAAPAHAFCGFYVAKADAKLFNKASKVVVARKGEQTAVTMASDYQGDLKEFALVIPVPTVVKKDQIKIIESAWVDHLDAYSAPRLVEYFDPDPCSPPMPTCRAVPPTAAPWRWHGRHHAAGPSALGVKIEAEYTVGEYDILILSAHAERRARHLAHRERLQDPATAPRPCSAPTSSRT